MKPKLEQVTTCLQCGRWAIQEFDSIVLNSYPLQYPWHWKCGCGWTERGGIAQDNSDAFLERWNKENKI